MAYRINRDRFRTKSPPQTPRGRAAAAALLGALIVWAPSSLFAETNETAVRIAGSTRMASLLEPLARKYEDAHPGVTVKLEGEGSATGVARVAQAAADVAALARPITHDELQRLRHVLQTEPVGIPIAMDAVVFFVHPSNPLDGLTTEQIAALMSQKITLWRELGVPWEDRPIAKLGLPPGSGSRGVLQTKMLGGHGFSSDIVPWKSTREVVIRVGAAPASLGFGGLGERDGVRLLALVPAGGGDAVSPTPENIQSMRYPLAHYLYLYFPGQPQGEARRFLSFVLSPEGQKLIQQSQRGPLPLPWHAGSDEPEPTETPASSGHQHP